MSKDDMNGRAHATVHAEATSDGTGAEDPAQRFEPGRSGRSETINPASIATPQSGVEAGGPPGPSWFANLLASIGLGSGSLRDTLEQALHNGDDAHAFTAQERDMLVRLLRYGALRVDDLMVPRADIIAVEENEPVANVLQVFVDAGVSRIPLYNDTLDDPRGMVHVKDLLKAIVADATLEGVTLEDQGPVNVGAETIDIAALDLSKFDLRRGIGHLKVRRPVLFVPPSMPAMNLLLKMQSTRTHMALVVDEYGGTDGLVTIEDLVEQIVGEIDDEHDDEEDENISADTTAGLIVSARTPVEDLEGHLKLKLVDEEDEDDIDTIGGLVFTLVGRVPARGELIPHPSGLEFEVLDADPRRIKKLKVHVGKVRALNSAVATDGPAA